VQDIIPYSLFFHKGKVPLFRFWRLVILNAKEQIPRRMTGTRSIAFIFFTIKSPKAQGGRENEARFF
jgi:hypothetical protein